MSNILPMRPAETYSGSYLRAVITTQCPLACSYCHKEGDPSSLKPTSLDTRTWIELLTVALACGVKKLKFVGGEPLVRSDLPTIIRELRGGDTDLDISVITSGAVPSSKVSQCFEAGLSRCNVTIHGFRLAHFSLRGGTVRTHQLRQNFLQTVLSTGRPTKLNYVYTGPDCETDLEALLRWAANYPCTVAVLDDLSRLDFGHQTVVSAVERLAGAPIARWQEPDVHSLPTLRQRFSNGVVVETKDHQLGAFAPWSACHVCLRRRHCREGIVALRLTHMGELRPCMDRVDLGFSILDVFRKGGRQAAVTAWRDWLACLSPRARSRRCPMSALPTHYFFTADGVQRLDRRIAEAREIYQTICSSNPEARESGDSSVWHDNFAFEENQRQMFQWGRRIRDLENVRCRIQVVEPDKAPTRASVGTRVRYRFEDEKVERSCLVAGWDDGDPALQRVSYNSPIGAALVGASAGEERDIIVAGRTRTLTVIRIDPGGVS